MSVASQPAQAAAEIRIAQRIAQMIVTALLENRPPLKRARMLARLMRVGWDFEAHSLTYGNVYMIRGGRPFEQDANRSENAEAARILAAIAADALERATKAAQTRA
jgi:hypothetical protein